MTCFAFRPKKSILGWLSYSVIFLRMLMYCKTIIIQNDEATEPSKIGIGFIGLGIFKGFIAADFNFQVMFIFSPHECRSLSF